MLDKIETPGKPIACRAYSDERPVFDCSQVKPNGFRVDPFYVSGSWMHLQGIEQRQRSKSDPVQVNEPATDIADEAGNDGPLTEDQLVTRRLFDQYINRVGKIPTDELRAAIELVAARGQNERKFRELVLAEFKKRCQAKPPDESNRICWQSSQNGKLRKGSIAGATNCLQASLSKSPSRTILKCFTLNLRCSSK